MTKATQYFFLIASNLATMDTVGFALIAFKLTCKWPRNKKFAVERINQLHNKRCPSKAAHSRARVDVAGGPG